MVFISLTYLVSTRTFPQVLSSLSCSFHWSYTWPPQVSHNLCQSS